MRFAVAHARARGMPLHALRAWVAPYWRDQAALRWRRKIAKEAAHGLHAAFAAAMGGLPTDIPIELLIVEGSPGRLLVGYAARDHDVIVIGGRRQAHRPAPTHGSVARYCLRHARCPVVAVPAASLTSEVRIRQVVRQVERELRKLA